MQKLTEKEKAESIVKKTSAVQRDPVLFSFSGTCTV